MSIPDYQSLMKPLLEAASDGEVSNADAFARVASKLGLGEEDLAQLLPSGRQTVFANRCHWAKIYLSKAGAVEATRRGYFRITPRGAELLKDNEAISNKLLSQYPEFIAFVRGRAAIAGQKSRAEEAAPAGSALESAQTPIERIEAARQEILAETADELLDRILDLSWQFFERLVIDLLVTMGYGGSFKEAGQALTKTGDEGVDGLIKQDPLGIDVVYVQAKRWRPGNSVGRPVLQAFSGSLDGFGATKGIFVTTSNFTAEAAAYVAKISKRIVLIDGARLAELMLEHGVGVRTEAIEIKRIDENYFAEG